ncbi:MAG: serine/threonine-protein kinase, partial [Aeoliella sp.]
MSDTPRCPKCDAELPKDAPAGLCPNCLVAAGLESEPERATDRQETTPFSPPGGPFVPPEPEELAERFAELDILGLLGVGGMGAVYKARQKELDRLVAVKVLPPEVGADPTFAERFSREAKALARLGHPNIVAVYDAGQRDGLFYFVMEHVDGVSLREAMHAGDLEPQQALSIVAQVCEALQYAHNAGIVHR